MCFVCIIRGPARLEALAPRTIPAQAPRTHYYRPSAGVALRRGKAVVVPRALQVPSALQGLAAAHVLHYGLAVRGGRSKKGNCMRFSIFAVVVAILLSNVAGAAPPFVASASAPGPLVESKDDNLNIWRNVSDYAFASKSGAIDLLSEDPKTFIVAWTPPDFARQEIRRTLVLLHPMNGIAYTEFRQALQAASKDHYALLAIQWWVAPEEHLGARGIYELADRGLHYLSDKYHATPHAAALWATGRAATFAYEIAYWDRKLATNHFALFVCNSGGLHPETPSALMRKIRDGDLGDTPYAGAHFFLYAATKDDAATTSPTVQSPPLAETLKAAKAIIEDSGGKVDALIVDPAAKSTAFRSPTNSHAADAVQLFLDLTSDVHATTRPAAN